MIPVPNEVFTTLALSYGANPQSLVFLGGGKEESDGIVYSYEVDGSPRVIKILVVEQDDPEGFFRIKERARFVRFLGEHGVDIVLPLPSQNGNLIETCLSNNQTFVAYTMDRVNGSHPTKESWNEELYRNWGRTIGKLHRITKLYPSWRYSEVEELPGRKLLEWEEEWRYFDAECKDPEIRECWTSIYNRMRRLPISREGFGFIHNDPHIYNLLVEGSRIVLLDFDVAGYNWFVNDIAIAMQPLLFEVTGGLERTLTDAGPLHDFLTHFLAGYEEENHLDPCWLEQIDLFISFRRALLYLVWQDVPPPNPDAKKVFREMILSEPSIVNEKSNS